MGRSNAEAGVYWHFYSKWIKSNISTPCITVDQKKLIIIGDFLRFNGREVSQNFGTVKREVAEKLALDQYEQYDFHRRMLEASDDVDELTEDVKRLKR